MGIYMDMHGCAFAVLATHYDDARHAPPALEGIGVYRSSIFDRVHLTITAPGDPVVICMRCHTSVVVAPLTSGMQLL
jgi:hypothetical protein